MRRSAAALLVAGLTALSACSSAPTASTSSSVGPSIAPSSNASAAPSSPTPSHGVATLASGAVLPACTPGTPKASDTVTFVASGYAWALSPSGTHLTCLFRVTNAGPFVWGPLGDRALLGGLAVRGAAGGPSLAASNRTFNAITWSRPTGKSIVYAPTAESSLKKVHLDGTPTQDVTPFSSSTYLSVTYHPSGEAFAFAVERSGGQSIWMSSNTGKAPIQLVFSEEGTVFGAIGFDVDGKHLLYAAQHADNHAELHRIDVTDTTQAPVVWAGPVDRMIMDIQPGLKSGTSAWTTGTTSCADSIAMAQTPAGTVRVLPAVDRPTQAMGWLGATQLLVATGGCGGPLDLSAVEISSGSIVPLVSGVSAAAVRTQAPKPPARLPASVPGSGFS